MTSTVTEPALDRLPTVVVTDDLTSRVTAGEYPYLHVPTAPEPERPGIILTPPGSNEAMWVVDDSRCRLHPTMRPYLGYGGWWVRASEVEEFPPAPDPVETGPTDFDDVPSEHRDTIPDGARWCTVTRPIDGLPAGRYLVIDSAIRAGRIVLAAWPGHPSYRSMYNRTDHGVRQPWRGYVLDGQHASVTMDAAPPADPFAEVPEEWRATMPEGARWLRLTRPVDGMPEGRYLGYINNGVTYLATWPGHSHNHMMGVRPGLPSAPGTERWQGWTIYGGDHEWESEPVTDLFAEVPAEWRSLIPAHARWGYNNRTSGSCREGRYLAIPQTEYPDTGVTVMTWPNHPSYGSMGNRERYGIPLPLHGYRMTIAGRWTWEEPVTEEPVTQEPLPLDAYTVGQRVEIHDHPAEGWNGPGTVTNNRHGNLHIRSDYDGVGEGAFEARYVRPLDEGTAVEPVPAEEDRFAVGNWYSWGTRTQWFRIASVDATLVRYNATAQSNTGIRVDSGSHARNRAEESHPAGSSAMPNWLRDATLSEPDEDTPEPVDIEPAYTVGQRVEVFDWGSAAWNGPATVTGLEGMGVRVHSDGYGREGSFAFRHIRPLVDEHAARIAELEAEVERLRTSYETASTNLTTTQEQWQNDLNAIGELMREEAENRDWCGEYEGVMGRINDNITGTISGAFRNIEVTVDLRGTVSVPWTASLSVEVPYNEQNNDAVHAAVRAWLEDNDASDLSPEVGGAGSADWSSVDDDEVEVVEWESDE